MLPLVLLSTAATVIASQAVISGAFSLSRQAIQLGLMPPLDIFQTSTRAHGQIYIPQINWLLLIAVLALVLGFQSSSALASAYGFAVTGTMTITTVLAGAVMRGVWRWQWPSDRRRAGADHDGRPRAVRGKCAEDPDRRLVPVGDRARRFHDHDHLARGPPVGAARLASETVPLASFLATCEEAPEARVSGTAVFLTAQTDTCP